MVVINDSKPILDRQDLDNAEKMLGIQFPAVYRAFMLRNNGGRPEPDEIKISWSHEQFKCDHWGTSLISSFLSVYDGEKANFLKYNQITFKGRIPKNTIAIAYDAGGNLILLGVGNDNYGKVLFWVKDHEVEEDEEPNNDNVGFLANSLTEFLDKLD